MVIRNFIFDKDSGDYPSYWENFDKHHDPIWRQTAFGIIGTATRQKHWEDYCSRILKDIGQVMYNYPDHMYIDFNTEEDMINFILKWS